MKRLLSNGLILGIVLIIVGLAITNYSPSYGGFLGLIGFCVFFVSLIRRIIGKLKRKKVDKKNNVETAIPAEQPATKELEQAKFLIETHKVAGVSFRQKEIESIGTYNYQYDMSKSEIEEDIGTECKVWQYEFSPKATLVPEPDNPYGKNTVRVEADGVHIGYIKSGSSAHVKKLIDENRIHKVDIEIGGGKYKMVTEYEDDDGNEKTELVKGSTDYGYFAKLTLQVYPEAK